MKEKELDKIIHQIKFTGTRKHPRWEIWNDGYLEGKVACPCNGSEGGLLTKHQAMRKIVGQIAALGTPWYMAEASLGKYGEDKRPWIVWWNARLAVSAVVLINCWERNCAPKKPRSGDETLTSLLQDEDGSKMDFGGGAAC